MFSSYQSKRRRGKLCCCAAGHNNELGDGQFKIAPAKINEMQRPDKFSKNRSRPASLLSACKLARAPKSNCFASSLEQIVAPSGT